MTTVLEYIGKPKVVPQRRFPLGMIQEFRGCLSDTYKDLILQIVKAAIVHIKHIHNYVTRTQSSILNFYKN